MATKPGLNPNDPRPPYRQLADALRADFVSGAKLPRITDLRSEWDVSAGTVRAAVKLLKDDGLVISTPSQGMYYVAERPELAAAAAASDDNPGEIAALAKQAADLARRLAALARDERK